MCIIVFDSVINKHTVQFYITYAKYITMQHLLDSNGKQLYSGECHSMSLNHVTCGFIEGSHLSRQLSACHVMASRKQQVDGRVSDGRQHYLIPRGLSLAVTHAQLLKAWSVFVLYSGTSP